MSSEDEPAEPFGGAYLADWRQLRLKDAKSSYNKILNRLWAGNSAGAAANLALIFGLLENLHAPLIWDFIPLFLFASGLTVLGVGSLIGLILETRVIQSMETTNSILDVKVDNIKRPSEHAGLSFANCQTKLAIISALVLILGVIVGFIILVWSSYG
jgi:hypothetical protein